MHIAFLNFAAAFDSPHRGRLLNALRADRIPGKFVRLLGDMNQRRTVAVRTPATTPVRTGCSNRRIPGKFVRLLGDMNQRRTVAVRTPATTPVRTGCTTPFEVVTAVRQGAVAGPFLFNFAIDVIMKNSRSVS
ncbi:hypothetical protein RB195_006219 [Necator americanus]|uniref:Reverse transcriptase domain-containing protein n=1 Tax=Necator americanus TaxID=51031 RepID=A0ABR1BRJ7_NECAM